MRGETVTVMTPPPPEDPLDPVVSTLVKKTMAIRPLSPTGALFVLTSEATREGIEKELSEASGRPVRIGPFEMLALAQAAAHAKAVREARAALCKCDHLHEAHGGEDHNGPCEAKLCRKWTLCQSYRRKG
jgi:hypothetical protein